MTQKKIAKLTIGNAELSVEGEWIKNWKAVKALDTLPAGEHTYEYDISSIIPKDGYKYLVEFRLNIVPSTMHQAIYGDFGTTIEPLGPLRFAAYHQLEQWAMMLVGTDRKVTFKTRSNSNAGTFDLYINKYKRLAG